MNVMASGQKDTTDPNLAACWDKADIFYDVIKQLRNCDFKYFVRTKLKLPEHEIDNIETDVSRDVQEQQYKMLLKWESKTEDASKRLLELLQEYKNEFTMDRGSVADMNVMTRSDLQYRLVVEKVCQKLTDEELERLNSIYFRSTQSNFNSGRDLFYHMEDNNLWGEGRSTTDKLSLVQQSLRSIERNDLALEIDRMKKEYLVSYSIDDLKGHRWSTTDVEIDDWHQKVVIRRNVSAPNTPHRKSFRLSATSSEPPLHLESMGEELVGYQVSHPSRLWRNSESSDRLYLKDENDLEKEGKSQEALSLLRKQMQLDSNHRDILLLIKCFLIAVKAGNFTEVSNARERLTNLIQINIETSAREIKTFAEKLRNTNSNLKAILFCLISSDFYASERSEQNTTSRGIERCAHGIKQASIRILQDDATGVQVVNGFVIPALKEMFKKFQYLHNDDETSRCINKAKCFRHLSAIEGALGNHKTRLELLFEAITLLRSQFGENEVSKFYVYGRCLNALGRTHIAMKDLPSAKHYFQLALEATKQAEDFESEQDQMVEVKTIENNIKSVGSLHDTVV